MWLLNIFKSITHSNSTINRIRENIIRFKIIFFRIQILIKFVFDLYILEYMNKLLIFGNLYKYLKLEFVLLFPLYSPPVLFMC